MVARRKPGAPSCCGPDVGECCDLITSFTYDENTFLLTLTTAYGSVFTVDLSSLEPDGVVNSVSYDPVTRILTVTTTVGTIYTTLITIPIRVANTLFVMGNGNDSTGNRERLDRPYRTPWGAILAALPGDTVIVYPGSYNNTNVLTTDYLAKNLVKLHLIHGASITYNGSPDIVRPLWDQGVAITFEITGNGIITLNQTPASSISNLMSALSVYRITLDAFITTTRLFSVSGSYFYLKALRIVSSLNASFVTWRNNIQTNTTFIIDCQEYTQTSFVTVLTPIDLRNFGIAGVIDIRINHFKSGRVFKSTGCFYFLNCQGIINLRVDRNTENDLQIKSAHYAVFIATSATLNIVLNNITFSGVACSFVSPYIAVPSQGMVSVQGIFTTVQPLVLNHVFAVGSRVQLLYDVSIIDNFNLFHWEFTNVLTTIHFSGKINYSTIGGGAPFRNNNLGIVVQTAPSLRNLVVETNTTYIFTGSGPTQAPVNCMSVYCNVGFDPALHASAIEPITISPAVTV